MNAVAAFLDASHDELSRRLRAWIDQGLVTRAEPNDDVGARDEAKRLLKEIGSAGWLQAIEPQDLRALCLVREAMAGENPLADAVVAIQGLVATALVIAGTDDQRRQWLSGLLTGRVMAGFAMSEPDAGSDVAAIRTVARKEGATWIIGGEKHLISNAGLADVYLVFAKSDPQKGSRGMTAFVVPSETRGVEFAGSQVMAAPHPLGRVRFNECRVDETAVLGEVDRGFKLGMMTLDRLRPTVGAAACGMAARALNEAVSHAQARRQFGQALADMPLVQAKLGRMATELDAARLLVYRAAWEHAQGVDRISASAAMAKSFATETAQRIVDDAVQIVGGRGALLGHPVERLYRSVRALRIYEGATDIQHLIVAGDLLDKAGRA